MASSALPLFLLALSLFALSVTARPCKTIFFYTTTTTTPYIPTITHNPNPNFNNFPFQNDHPLKSPKIFTLFFTTIPTRDHLPLELPFRSRHAEYFSLRGYPFTRFVDDEAETQKRMEIPDGFYSSVMNRGSIKDRTRDIMGMVGAMLFGVGCGALTAATMYLVWSLTSRFGAELESDDDDFEEDEDVSPKKVGYVAIPDDDIDAIKKAAQAQAKMEAKVETA